MATKLAPFKRVASPEVRGARRRKQLDALKKTLLKAVDSAVEETTAEVRRYIEEEK